MHAARARFTHARLDRHHLFARPPTPLNPIAPPEREPILDALRGFAILGILLVNIEMMRGPDWLGLISGGAVAASGAWDTIVRFAIGWLATGKFLSSLAILFGVGAALIAARSMAAAQSPRPLLARRYAWLMVFGIAHMPIFPGDILFLYAVTGFALLPFVRLRVRTILWWSAASYVAYIALGLGYLRAVFQDAGEPAADSVDTFQQDPRAEAAAAFTAGSFGDILAVHAGQALLLQTLQLTALPWILAMFLFGFTVARAGILNDLNAHRALLRRGAWFGLLVGLPANFALGFGGPLSGWGPSTEPAWITNWAAFGQLIGEPVLAVGYLCALSLFCMRRGAIGPLAAVGRMALTAYLLQSALGLAVFGALRLYGHLSTASALLVVAGIWAVLLVICPLWLRWFQLGPVEWLWRSLTYGRAQAMRIPSR